MANRVSDSLSEALLQKLSGEQYVLLATLDHETGSPAVSAISWAYAPDTFHVRAAVGYRSRIVANIKAHPQVSAIVIGPDSTYEISGTARIIHEPLAGVQIRLAGLEIQVEAVRDAMFFGAKITQEPQYAKTYDKETADKLDQQVLEALRWE